MQVFFLQLLPLETSIQLLVYELLYQLFYMLLNLYSCPFVLYNYSSQMFKGCYSKVYVVTFCNNVFKSHCTKSEVFQFPAGLVTLTEEILNGKLNFLCSVSHFSALFSNFSTVSIFSVNSQTNSICSFRKRILQFKQYTCKVKINLYFSTILSLVLRIGHTDHKKYAY